MDLLGHQLYLNFHFFLCYSERRTRDISALYLNPKNQASMSSDRILCFGEALIGLALHDWNIQVPQFMK